MSLLVGGGGRGAFFSFLFSFFLFLLIFLFSLPKSLALAIHKRHSAEVRHGVRHRMSDRIGDRGNTETTCRILLGAARERKRPPMLL